MHRRSALLSVAMATGLVLMSCGGDDDASDAATETTVAGTTPTTAAFDESALAAAVTDHRASAGACDGQAAPLPDGAAAYDRLATVDGGTRIVLVTCDVFAYQATFELAAWDGDSLRTIDVEQWVDGAVSTGRVVLGNPQVVGSQIVNLEKARGPGDCGLYSTWDYDGTLVLREARVRECATPGDAADAVDPASWDLVYERPPRRNRVMISADG